MARTTKDSPEVKKMNRFINLVSEMRRLQKLAENCKDPHVRSKHTVKANGKARAVDKAIEKLAA